MTIANVVNYVSSIAIPYNSVNFIGRANYSYLNKYHVEFNASYRGSENFAPGRRFGFFPSVSASWNVHEENFMKKVSFIDRLKFRASYGMTVMITPAHVSYIKKEMANLPHVALTLDIKAVHKGDIVQNQVLQTLCNMGESATNQPGS